MTICSVDLCSSSLEWDLPLTLPPIPGNQSRPGHVFFLQKYRRKPKAKSAPNPEAKTIPTLAPKLRCADGEVGVWVPSLDEVLEGSFEVVARFVDDEEGGG